MNKCIDILENLLSFNDEYEWLDFKEKWFSKDEIGKYISAISNGTALCGKENGYIVWGVEDTTDQNFIPIRVSIFSGKTKAGYWKTIK